MPFGGRSRHSQTESLSHVEVTKLCCSFGVFLMPFLIWRPAWKELELHLQTAVCRCCGAVGDEGHLFSSLLLCQAGIHLLTARGALEQLRCATAALMDVHSKQSAPRL